jgi:hypothetical protein
MSVASILSGTPAGLAEVARVGTATIALGAKIVTVSNANVTANSFIIVWGVGAADATAFVFSVDNLAAGSFQIGTNANATAAKTVGYAILKY